MSTKPRLFLTVIAAVAVAALFYMGFRVRIKNYDGLLLAAPKTAGTAGIDIEKLEDINDDKFPLTYECPENKPVSAINSNHNLTVIGTNYTYSFVMGYRMIRGGFFTWDDQDRQLKNAVLNRKAAFELFGGMDTAGNEVTISGAKYRILGVLEDDSPDEANIYIPVTLVKSFPDAIMTRLDEKKGISEEYVKNELKQAGITDSSYTFQNLGRSGERIQAVAWFSLGLGIFAALVFALKHTIKSLLSQFQFFKTLSQQLYLKELLAQEPAKAVWLLLTAGFFFGVCAILVGMLTGFVNGFLKYQMGTELFSFSSPLSFKEPILFLQNINLYANITFLVFALCFIMSLLPDIRRK